MKYVLITIAFLGLYIITSLIMILIFKNPGWINNYSTLLGLGLFICFSLNIVGTINGFREYRKKETNRKERIATWLNLGLVIFFIGAMIIPNVMDMYDAFSH